MQRALTPTARFTRWGLWVGLLALAGAGLCLSAGCSSVAYLAQSAQGHFGLLAAAKPIDAWLAAPETPAPLKARLVQSQSMRRFAVEALGLPDNQSYTRYADLGRPAAVWNVVAAPELSLTLQTWCFPVVGCVAYRGYYSLEAAQSAAQPLREAGWEVGVYPVPAYSSLGWAEWWGGDPLLNTFISWPEPELARMVFHELAHQVVYVPGDTVFNESYATAVERLGLVRWLQTRTDATQAAQVAALEARRADYRALTSQYRQALQAVYTSGQPAAQQRESKQSIMAAFRADYAQLKAQRWGGYSGYDGQMANANNASLALQAAYHQWVPAFEALFHAQGEDFPRFHRVVAEWAALPSEAREAELRRWMPTHPNAAPSVPTPMPAPAPRSANTH